MAYYVGRRYGDFGRLHKKLRTELPGKILPPMPKKNRQSSIASNLVSGVVGNEDDVSSLSSVSTMGNMGVEPSMKSLTIQGEKNILFETNLLANFTRKTWICICGLSWGSNPQIFIGCYKTTW
jgi:hypothetical protein